MSNWSGRPLVIQAIEAEKVNSLAAQLETARDDDMRFDEVRAACAQGNLSILKLLLEKGGARFLKDVDRPSGRTLLHEAAERGHTPLCKRLLDLGVDPTKLGDGVTAAELATKSGFPETAAFITTRMAGGAGPAAPAAAAPKSAPAATGIPAPTQAPVTGGAPPPPIGKQGAKGPSLPPPGPPAPKPAAEAAPSAPYAGPPCVRGHPTQIFTLGHYTCDRCGSAHQDKYAFLTRHRCTQCGYDMCAACAPMPPNWEKLVATAPPPSAKSAPRQRPLPPPAPVDPNAPARPIVVLKAKNDYAPGFHQFAHCPTSGCKGYMKMAKSAGTCKRCQEADSEPHSRLECTKACGFSLCSKCDAAVRSECYLCACCLAWFAADNMHRHAQVCKEFKCPRSSCAQAFPSRRERDAHMWAKCVPEAQDGWISRHEAEVEEKAKRDAAAEAEAAPARSYASPSASAGKGGACKDCRGAGQVKCSGCSGKGYWGAKGDKKHEGCKGTGVAKCGRCRGTGKD